MKRQQREKDLQMVHRVKFQTLWIHLFKTPNNKSSPINTTHLVRKNHLWEDRTYRKRMTGLKHGSRLWKYDEVKEVKVKNLRDLQDLRSEKSYDGKREWDMVLSSMRNVISRKSTTRRQGGESKINGTRLRFGDSPPEAPSSDLRTPSWNR